MATTKRPKILIAPLDWGLGHATRCIPIINQLLSAGCEIIVASEGKQKHLLKTEFPFVKFLDLSGYRINYSKNDGFTLRKIIFQIPKILIQINREKRWLNRILSKEKPDAIISDNRYGFYSRSVPSIFITHQLHIKAPFGKKTGRALQTLNYRFINRFSFCWVPDFGDGINLAGELSHPDKLPVIPTRYIGPLTRFAKLNKPIENNLLVIISGPEPQRTVFEDILFKQLGDFNGKVVVVRGLPGANEMPSASPHITIHNHLSSEALNDVIERSEFIISRAGYSTIMDLLALGKKSILVPTPGQPEQEYLAEYLFKSKIIFSAKQQSFNLSDCMEKAKQFSFVKIERNKPALLKDAISEMLNKIS